MNVIGQFGCADVQAMDRWELLASRAGYRIDTDADGRIATWAEGDQFIVVTRTLAERIDEFIVQQCEDRVELFVQANVYSMVFRRLSDALEMICPTLPSFLGQTVRLQAPERVLEPSAFRANELSGNHLEARH